MLIEEAAMKALKVENSQGHFLTEDGTYETIDKIEEMAIEKGAYVYKTNN